VLAGALLAGFARPPEEFTPILPIVLGEGARALAVSSALRERGFFAQAIRPPTVPPGTARLRLVPIATHTDADIASAAAALTEVLARLPLEALPHEAALGGSR
jgi:7-keto-8-aminopelargonate synthetase-like enzyme